MHIMNRKYHPVHLCRLSLLTLALIASGGAYAQSSGLGVDLQFGDKLDPSGGQVNYGCDLDGISWLTGERKRTPTGFMYSCPPDYPESKEKGNWLYRGKVQLGYINIAGDENNTNWRRFSNWKDGYIFGGSLSMARLVDGTYVDIRASRINEDSQYLRAVFGRAGKYRVQAFGRSQSNVLSGNARSIWDGVGTNHLTLKPGLTPAGSTSEQAAAIIAGQRDQTLKVVRDKFGVGINYHLNTRWTAFGNVSHESRKGARPFGGAFFFNYIFPGNGGAYETPRPIDDSTINFNGGARYSGNLWRMQFSYTGSFFRHANRGFDYEVPFALSSVAGVPNFSPKIGQFSYEPNNDYHLLRTSFTRKIAWDGEFSLTASGGISRQNDRLLAPMPCASGDQFGQAIIPGAAFNCSDWNSTAALSRSRADLAINTQMVDARVVLQPREKWTVQAAAKFYREDYSGTYWAYNPLTGQWGYPAENGSQGAIIPGEMGVWDPITSPGAFTRIRNLPLDKETNEVSFGGDWRASDSNTLGATYTFTRTERGNREIATTRDHSVKLTWYNRSLDWLNFRANYTYLRRTGSEYNSDPYAFTYSSALPGFTGAEVAHTITALRKYDISERIQNKLDLMATFTLPKEMMIYASVRGDWNDYDAQMGRQGYNTLGTSLQWEWQPTVATVASAWLGYDRSRLALANINDAASTSDPNLGGATYPVSNRWWSTDRQRNQYAGVNFTQRIGKAILDGSWNWTYSRGITSYDAYSTGALTNPAVAPYLTGQFPAMTYRINSFTLGLTMPLRENINLRIFDTYEHGNISDWHYLGFENDQIKDHRVYTDGGPRNYGVNMIGLLLEVKL